MDAAAAERAGRGAGPGPPRPLRPTGGARPPQDPGLQTRWQETAGGPGDGGDPRGSDAVVLWDEDAPTPLLGAVRRATPDVCAGRVPPAEAGSVSSTDRRQRESRS